MHLTNAEVKHPQMQHAHQAQHRKAAGRQAAASSALNGPVWNAQSSAGIKRRESCERHRVQTKQWFYLMPHLGGAAPLTVAYAAAR